MAFLARYGHVSPTEYWTLEPAETRALTRELRKLLAAENEMQMRLAQLGATGRMG